MTAKYIFISGGVISSLGKGITAASIAKLLQSKGYEVTNVKCEMYVNIDAGTIRPTEHGEVFVTADGIETDQDIGSYERFLGKDLNSSNFLTTGQIYQAVISRERNLEYDGEDVEVVPHVPEEIIRRVKEAGEKTKAEFVIVELGGTVGEYQGVLFLEANRMMKLKDPKNICHIHVSYLPIPSTVGEMKTKPVQYSVRTLNAAGIQPDFVVGRAALPLDEKRKEKISLFCSVPKDNVISNPDISSIYGVPLIFDEQEFAEKILKHFNLKPRTQDLREWKKLVNTIKTVKEEVKIGIVGKYFQTGDFTLEDSYISIIEAVKHAAWANNLKPVIQWLASEKYEKDPKDLSELKNYDGVIVPGGYGSRGVPGKILAIEYLRKNRIPFLGLCYGMQLATIEFARNVAGLKDANTTEVNPKTAHPVISLMSEQEEFLKNKNYGDTQRLGNHPCKILPRTLAGRAYGKTTQVMERHRHRYEFNNAFRDVLEKKGLIISGINPERNLVEIIELAAPGAGSSQGHPFFLGTQFHPEFKSRPLNPHPLFKEFVRVSASNKKRSL
ncbi:MAG: CTP synthase [Candidatus Pacebacteria bacterium]|nr:CTP synthase [Candidatus Paceibacterota bacterium]